jgi:glycolate oxidase
LLVGSEGTLAILTKITLRLIPRPATALTIRACFAGVEDAVAAVTALIERRVVPATLELVDRASLEAAARYLGRGLAPEGTGAVLLLQVDGFAAAVAEEARLVEQACRSAAAIEVQRAEDADAQDALWQVRRQLSYAMRTIAGLKINHDVVVPRGRIPELFQLVERLRTDFQLTIAAFGHAGDGNIHVNIMVDPDDADAVARARRAEPVLFQAVVALEGSITGEHGIGFSKAPYLGIELSPDEIALMKRIKHAFDPNGILNPGKIFQP